MADTPGKLFPARKRWWNRETWSRFIRMLGRFVASKSGRRARWLFLLLILLLLAINGLNVTNSFVGRDFMTALERRSVSIFLRQALLYIGVFALSTLADVTLRYTEETLALVWREWLTHWLVSRYLSPPVYLRLNDFRTPEREVPNPDQRISEDVRTFTASSFSFVILFLNGTITICAFSGVLWSISPPLFLVTLLYAAAGSLLAVVRGRPLVALTVAQLDREANFRAELIRVRENAEAVAVSRREPQLMGRLVRRIEDFVANFKRIIRINRNLGFFITGYNYLIQIIPALIVGPLFIRGQVDFGVVTQSAMAFSQLVGACSLIITQFQSISSYAAVVTRLGVLDEAMEVIRSLSDSRAEPCSHGRPKCECPTCRPSAKEAPFLILEDSGPENRVVFDHLTLRTPPEGRLLLRELTGVVPAGMRLLILGPNEEAKTALFQAAAGLWSTGSGRLLRPLDSRMRFLAEKPYLPPGTLRDILTSGGPPARPIPEDRILGVLQDLDLEPVLVRSGGLDTEQRWESLLSLGEQQRVAFAYVMLADPGVVFLERTGSALGPEETARLIGALAARSVTILNIGRPGDPRRSYNAVLELSVEGRWTWRY